MRTLFLDIETAPSTAYVWSLFDQHVPLARVISPGQVLCFAAKWQGAKTMTFRSVHEHGREKMLEDAHALLDEADVVIHYNGTKFDIPHLNAEFVVEGMAPPAPFKQIDLYRTVRRRFRMLSRKLDFVAQQLGLGGKVKHEGFDLWVLCMEGDPSAWRRMEKYNRQDVKLLEDLYARLLPWIPNHPSRPLYDGSGACPLCGAGHERLQRRGYSYTSVSAFQRWQCQECKGWLRSKKREGDTADVRQAPS